ncbi:MAG: malate synthase G [Methylococcaceae bacterium]|nr:malate synthase G [Methylococcaceae bacterium]
MYKIRNHFVEVGDLDIDKRLYDLVQDEIIPETGVDAEHFWISLADIVKDFGTANSRLLAKRDELQAQIDQWHRSRSGQAHDPKAYREFLEEIGYLVPEPDDFQISTSSVDAEIAAIAGPQLVVPLDNARYVLNAANARWGSLYDALYGTDVIPESEGCKKIKKYNPIRGEKVIQVARHFLDRHFQLEKDTHHHVVQYRVVDGQLIAHMGDGTETTLLRAERFKGYNGNPKNPDQILLRKNNLYVEIRFGEGYFIGRRDHANIYDIHMESAITSIMDCEDSVASVDTEDKINVYRNWLELMKGTLVRKIEKDDRIVERTLEPDRTYIAPDGGTLTVHGRSLMLVRNVGTHLETDSVLLRGKPIPETFLDAMVTALCAKHDLAGNAKYSNSRAGSIYIVKPKMHGPDEVHLASELFARVEDALSLDRNTLKMGIMDEERRTSVNLKACVHAARERVCFINTGFLDRTGDDIHTNMEAGPMLPKAELKTAKWLRAYENSNVDVGLKSGLAGRAQIGKGMWAMPDEMMAMMETKILQLKEGANTAWVPSPTAATLHAMHYHIFDVHDRQNDLKYRKQTPVDAILDIPVLPESRRLSREEIQRELENNAQGILGYVARWVGQGVGCSKVPDINNIALMEDCATLRISSQHIANWLHHGILNEKQVREAMKTMAILVDRQNSGDPHYKPMSADFASSIPFQAALDLALKGRRQPNGYTEFILYARRREEKAS